MDNPVLRATSPSNFWGRRWNALAHGMIKRGMFKPIQKYFSTSVASVGAFVASGLFHEYLVHLVLMYDRDPRVVHTSSCPIADTTCKPQIGSNMAFFVWNGALVLFEKLLKRHQTFKNIGSALPHFVITFLIIMTALPVAHWFGNPYIKCGYFHDLQEGFLLVVKIV